jgi:hypothetical protein
MVAAEQQLLASQADEIEVELNRQNGNPVNVVCSGLEERAEREYFAGGKWRKLSRSK